MERWEGEDDGAAGCDVGRDRRKLEIAFWGGGNQVVLFSVV